MTRSKPTHSIAGSNDITAPVDVAVLELAFQISGNGWSGDCGGGDLKLYRLMLDTTICFSFSVGDMRVP